MSNMPKPSRPLPALPPPVNLETTPILKALAKASRTLAELKGLAAAIPNQSILIDTLFLQEAQASSAVENIVTTQDELFQANIFPEGKSSPATKEVARYSATLKHGHDRMLDLEGKITNSILVEMFRLLKELRNGGFRKTPVHLKHIGTGETIYVPPDAQDVKPLMTELERFINDDEACSLDPLIKMALIHHQFESIHPFSDGNGRIGRILNILYLTRTGLLDIPVLCLSRHITRTKSDYYRLLQGVRKADGAPEAWEAWVLYMLEAVASTAYTTLELVEGIREQMRDVKSRMKKELPRLYSQGLLNNLFRYPYTSIGLVMHELDITRQTAARYLNALADKGFVEKHKDGKYNYYINTALARLFWSMSAEREGEAKEQGT